MTMEREELHDLLERLWDRYDREEFISADPVSYTHLTLPTILRV